MTNKQIAITGLVLAVCGVLGYVFAEPIAGFVNGGGTYLPRDNFIQMNER